jgi:hypothetical protein
LLELRGWLSSRVGKAISQPSTIRTDARLTVFALRNVGFDNIEAADNWRYQLNPWRFAAPWKFLTPYWPLTRAHSVQIQRHCPNHRPGLR